MSSVFALFLFVFLSKCYLLTRIISVYLLLKKTLLQSLFQRDFHLVKASCHIDLCADFRRARKAL